MAKTWRAWVMMHDGMAVASLHMPRIVGSGKLISVLSVNE